MPIQALTIDFWNTMVVARTGGAARDTQRRTHLRRTLQALRPACTSDAIDAAYEEAIDRFQTTWTQDHRTPATEQLVTLIWDALAVAPDDELHAETVALFENGLLHGPPDFAEGLADALAWAAGRYRLAIISDTMFSPGRVIRELLDARGVLDHFEAFVFSDETGFAKPDRRAFTQAAEALGVPSDALAHIGDLHRTDIAGARSAGARAILFTGVRTDNATMDTTPDAMLPHWAALPDVLATLDAPPSS